MGLANAKVKILIADDHALFRAGLRALLEEHPNYQVAGEAVDGPETLRLASELAPDLLLLDIEMPGLNGVEVARRISQWEHWPRVIILTANVDAENIKEVLELGVCGVILKESAIEQLFRCIETVLAGKKWVGREGAAGAAGDVGDKLLQPIDGNRFRLTKREMEILTAIVAGRTNKELAHQLAISEQTVKHHVTNIFDKVGVYNRLELALFAIHHGLIRK